MSKRTVIAIEDMISMPEEVNPGGDAACACHDCWDKRREMEDNAGMSEFQHMFFDGQLSSVIADNFSLAAVA
jgi:hypothetical protein